MNWFVHVLPNALKTLVIGLSLAAVPYLASLYYCSSDPRPTENTPLSPAADTAASSPPNVLPAPDAACRLQTGDSQSKPILAAGFPAPQSEALDAAPGPELADPQQADNTQQAYIPPVGIILEENFDQAQAVASPSPWMPAEMPIAEAKAEPSPDKAKFSAAPSPEEKSSPLPKTPKTVTNSASSAVSVPAVRPAIVVQQSKTFSTDSGQLNSSTEPISINGALSQELEGRSQQLESIARQADQQIRHGFELAGRGAYFAARSEFIAALRLVAQGLDTDGQTTIHGKSLAAGLTALKEADDFLPRGSQLEADLDLPSLIAGHTTPVLKDADKTALTSLTALKCYFNFAQQQLSQAMGREVAGSMALRALGKLHEEISKSKGQVVKAAGPKAMVFYQASLLVFPQNYMAANDLGVMLARNGKYEDAAKMLEYCISLNKQSTLWHNLAMVYGSLGRRELAQQAQQQAVIARQTEQTRRQNWLVSSGDQVRWVDENTFAQANNPSGVLQGVHPAPASLGNPAPQQSALVPVAVPGILQPPPYQRWSAAADSGQPPATTNRTLPAMRPVTTTLLPKTSYDTRR